MTVIDGLENILYWFQPLSVYSLTKARFVWITPTHAYVICTGKSRQILPNRMPHATFMFI